MIQPDAPFDAPWQAHLFGLTVSLNEAGHFTWADWAAAFGPQVQQAEADAYWRIWSDCLVRFLDDRGIAAAADVTAMTLAWQEAAQATPHGQPILAPSLAETQKSPSPTTDVWRPGKESCEDDNQF